MKLRGDLLMRVCIYIYIEFLLKQSCLTLENTDGNVYFTEIFVL